MNMIVDTNFFVKQTVLILRTKFSQEVYFQLKTEKWNITIDFIIFELV